MRRRQFLTAAPIVGLAAVGALTISSRKTNGPPGQILTPGEFWQHARAMEFRYGSYPTHVVPQDQRRPNTDGSCVHLATGYILASIGRYDLAQAWMDMYSRGEYSSRHIRRMEAEGFLFAVETQGDPRFLDYFSGNTGEAVQRVMGVSYTTRHVMNLLDLDPPTVANPRAYLLNNQRRSGSWNWDTPVAAEVPRDEFIRGWDRRGGWAFTIFGTQQEGLISPNPPYPYVQVRRHMAPKGLRFWAYHFTTRREFHGNIC